MEVPRKGVEQRRAFTAAAVIWARFAFNVFRLQAVDSTRIQNLRALTCWEEHFILSAGSICGMFEKISLHNELPKITNMTFHQH
jgi:hypothetical protein